MNEFSIAYELFLAESEMFNSLMDISSNWVLFENMNPNIILEGVQDTINRYIDKVTKSTQKAWNKFKKKSNNKEQQELLKQVEPRISKAKSSFNIKNYPTYDMNTFNSIKIQPFDYTNKDRYRTKEIYYKSTYPDLYRLDKSNITKAVISRVLRNRSTINCDKDKLIETYQFCTREFEARTKSIEQDLNYLNNSNSVILNTVNNVITPSNESIMLYKDIRSDIYRAIHEADNSKSMTFTDSDGERTNSNDKKGNDSKKMFVNAVKVYMNVSCDILTAKMKVLTDAYKDYFAIINHFANNKLSDKGNAKPVTSVKSKINI